MIKYKYISKPYTLDELLAGNSIFRIYCSLFNNLYEWEISQEEDFEVFVVTDASGTFNPLTRDAAWDRMSSAGAQLMTWFGMACELHRDWRNDVEGLGALFSNHIPDYRNLMNSYSFFNSEEK